MAGKKKKTTKVASSKQFKSKKRSLDDFGFGFGDDDDVREAKSRRTRKKTQGGAANATPVERDLDELTKGLGAEIDALLNDAPTSEEASDEKPVSIEAVAADPEDPDIPASTANYFEMLGEADEDDGDDSLLPNPVALVEKAISADLDPSVFSGKSFPVASNVIEFCRDPDYLGFTGELFPRQIQVLAHYFKDVCYFCSDTEYIHDVPVDDPVGDVLDRFSFLRYGVCPRCKRNRTEILQDWINDSRFGEYNDLDPNVAANLRPVPPNEFVGVWGQRSGKSYTVGTFAFPYILHRYLALPSPTKYFRIPSNQVLEAAFVAPTLHQITKYVWTPFREAYAASPWFKEVRESLLYEGKRVGATLYREAERFVVFPGKNLAVHILAASSSGLRGGTRVFCSLDELGWFNANDDGKKRSGVKEGGAVFDALDNSLNTVRSRADDRRDSLGDYDVLDGHMFNISSPCHIGDPIMTRAARAPKAPRMFYTHYATWDVNPVEREDRIRERMAGDMERFLRNWAAIPPRALSPFFQDTDLVASLARKEERDRDDSIFKYYIEQYKMDSESIVRLRPHLQNVQADPYSARVLAVDNGEVNNSFALCVARYDPELDKVHFEEFVEVAPYRGHVVDLYWCYENFIVPLVNSFNFLHVGFDRWNSSAAYHDLQTNQGFNASTGKDAQIYTLKWPDFDAFREDLRGMNMSFPQPETEPDELLNIKDLSRRAATPRAHLLLQLTTVEQFGRKVMKPEQGNDDLFRVAVLAHRFIQKNKKKYVEFSRSLLRRRDNFRSVALFRGASNRGSGMGGSAYQDSPRPANSRSVGAVRSRSSFGGTGRKTR